MTTGDTEYFLAWEIHVLPKNGMTRTDPRAMFYSWAFLPPQYYAIPSHSPLSILHERSVARSYTMLACLAVP
jgi:hypothetical protein